MNGALHDKTLSFSIPCFEGFQVTRCIVLCGDETPAAGYAADTSHAAVMDQLRMLRARATANPDRCCMAPAPALPMPPTLTCNTL